MMLHCFYSSNSLFFLSGLDLISSNSLFFLSRFWWCFVGLDLMMLRCFFLWFDDVRSLAGKSSLKDSSSMELDLFTLDLAQQNWVLCTWDVSFLNYFENVLTIEIIWDSGLFWKKIQRERAMGKKNWSFFSLLLSSSSHICPSLSFLGMLKLSHSLFFISLPQNPLKDPQILQRNPSKGVAHIPKPTINGKHDTK